MTRLLISVGSLALGSLGWWLGEQFGGVLTAFVVSIIGTGLGIYGGRRLAQHWGA